MGKLEWALRYADAQAAEHEESDTPLDAQANGNVVQEGQQNFKLKLRGMMVDLDEEMWQMQIGEQEEEKMREEEDLDRDEIHDDDQEDQDGDDGP